jgi:YD repeat-containing protein
MHAEYNDNLVMTGLLVTPPGQGPTTQQWMHIEYDASGRPVRVSDCTGTETTITYDAAGRPESVVSGQGRTLIRRDEKGRLQTMQTSWGLRWDNRYDPRDQRLAETEIKVGDSSAKVELDGGSPGRVRQLDGGEYRFARYLEGLHAGQLREFQLPNTMRVGFDYDASSRVVGVTYGDVFRQNIRYDDRGRVTEVTRTPMRP